MTAPRIKVKVLPRFPASVTAISPVVLNRTGGNYVFSLDITALSAFVLTLFNLTQRVVTAAGAVTIVSADSDIIIVNKTVGAPTTANLPTAASRLALAPSGRTAIRVVDGKYDAATNNITIVPSGSEKIMGGSSYIIDSNGASIALTPLSDGTGWF